ncbi:MAG: RNA polymerase sigma factor [Archangium sp.]|nr:RNA polymerase sigma factor [Archangium sp.]
MTEELQLLGAMVSGDAHAFARWASSVEQPLRSALRPFATSVDTEAVLQETLLRIWQVVPRFTHDGRPNALLRFAMRTARNVAVTEWRRQGRADQQEALEQHLSAEATIAPITPDPHLREHIGRCKDKLPGQPKVALEQRLAADGTIDDTTLATRLGMSLNTFLQNFTRARKFLKECLEKAGIHLDGELT